MNLLKITVLLNILKLCVAFDNYYTDENLIVADYSNIDINKFIHETALVDLKIKLKSAQKIIINNIDEAALDKICQLDILLERVYEEDIIDCRDVRNYRIRRETHVDESSGDFENGSGLYEDYSYTTKNYIEQTGEENETREQNGDDIKEYNPKEQTSLLSSNGDNVNTTYGEKEIDHISEIPRIAFSSQNETTMNEKSKNRTDSTTHTENKDNFVNTNASDTYNMDKNLNVTYDNKEATTLPSSRKEEKLKTTTFTYFKENDKADGMNSSETNHNEKVKNDEHVSTQTTVIEDKISDGNIYADLNVMENRSAIPSPEKNTSDKNIQGFVDQSPVQTVRKNEIKDTNQKLLDSEESVHKDKKTDIGSRNTDTSTNTGSISGITVLIIIVVLVALAGLGAFGYSKYQKRKVRYNVVNIDDPGKEMKEIKKYENVSNKNLSEGKPLVDEDVVIAMANNPPLTPVAVPRTFTVTPTLTKKMNETNDNEDIKYQTSDENSKNADNENYKYNSEKTP